MEMRVIDADLYVPTSNLGRGFAALRDIAMMVLWINRKWSMERLSVINYKLAEVETWMREKRGRTR